MNQNFKPIMVHKITDEKLNEIAKILGKKKATIIREYIDSLFELLFSFERASIDYTVVHDRLTIKAFGKKKPEGELSHE